MKFIRRPSIARVLLVAALVVAWFTATNHCALGLMQQSRQATKEHSRCCGNNPAPAKQAPHEGMRECCKSIHATSTTPAAFEFGIPVAAADMNATIEAVAQRLCPAVFLDGVWDHGPPRALSFAESVLQRSLLGHAPPLA